MDKNKCKRVYVGTIYKCCAGSASWDECKYYEDSPTDRTCRWHYNSVYPASIDKCNCPEAILNAEKVDE